MVGICPNRERFFKKTTTKQSIILVWKSTAWIERIAGVISAKTLDGYTENCGIKYRTQSASKIEDSV
jgi:hypothetical protein